MNKITEIEQFLAPLLEQEHMELVDLQYASEAGRKVLRIFLDKDDGVKLDDCESMSVKIGSMLDTSDIIPDSYVLEVSSPGLDRILKKESDFVKFAGKKARVSTYAPVNGHRNFIGKIVSCEDGKITIDDETWKIITLDISAIARARLEPEI